MNDTASDPVLPDDPILTVAQVAKFFAVRKCTVNAWIIEGKLRAQKHSGRWGVFRDSVVSFTATAPFLQKKGSKVPAAAKRNITELLPGR